MPKTSHIIKFFEEKKVQIEQFSSIYTDADIPQHEQVGHALPNLRKRCPESVDCHIKELPIKNLKKDAINETNSRPKLFKEPLKKSIMNFSEITKKSREDLIVLIDATNSIFQ